MITVHTTAKAGRAPRRPPGTRLVELQQQIDQGGLAGSGAADQPDPLAGADREVEAVQHAAALVVSAYAAIIEHDLLEADRAGGQA